MINLKHNKITSFGENFIKVNNEKYVGNILLSDNGIIKNITDLVTSINFLSPTTLKQLLSFYNEPKDILLIGCGDTYTIPKKEIQESVLQEGFALEWMITKSAIHVYNFLIEDYRHVLALLFWE